MRLRATIVVGNPRPGSRTLKVAERLVERLLVPGRYELEIIDLANHLEDIFAWPSDELAALNSRVAESDIAVFASPTYKASHTGLMKAFLDRFGTNGLAGVIAIPLHTGGSLAHAMSPTVTLAPLLVELGAVIPGRGLYFLVDQADHLDESIEQAAAEYASNLARLARVAGSFAPPA